jgi:transposase InsO family protein
MYHILKERFAQQQIKIGRDKLFNILRDERLLVGKKKRYTKTTDSKHWMFKYSNRIKDLALRRPEQLWVADITYLYVKDTDCYLHLVTDAYSKQIMGYHLSENLAATSTVQALDMALTKRQYNGSLIHHSDRGLQYCSALYTKRLSQHDIAISMTESGSPYDNAIAERVNGILKDEFGLDEVFDNIKEVELQVRQSIEIYNTARPHISNHLLTPHQMHLQQTIKPKAWHKKIKRTLESSLDFLPSAHINKTVNLF